MNRGEFGLGFLKFNPITMQRRVGIRAYRKLTLFNGSRCDSSRFSRKNHRVQVQKTAHQRREFICEQTNLLSSAGLPLN